MSAAIQKASVALVDRARHGDQNAIAMICEVRKNRRRGNRDAALAYDYMMNYVRRKPSKPRPLKLFGEEPTSFEVLKKAGTAKLYGRSIVEFVLEASPSSKDSKKAAHMLAMIRPVDMRALRDVLRYTPPDLRGHFGNAYRHPGAALRNVQGLKEQELKCLQLGYILGLARAIQEACEPEASLRKLSSSVAWELGEE